MEGGHSNDIQDNDVISQVEANELSPVAAKFPRISENVCAVQDYPEPIWYKILSAANMPLSCHGCFMALWAYRNEMQAMSRDMHGKSCIAAPYVAHTGCTHTRTYTI